MPLTPDDSLEPAAQSLPPTETLPAAESAPSQGIWRSRVVRICLTLFTFEIGVFLVIFPWTDSWGFNYVQQLAPAIQGVWNHPYFRGAVTGLGFLNVYLSCLEVILLFRRS
ncbi:MAG: hypothetical protein ABSB35_25480 [Bryobacteraceae bacterium]|jgi:hypothetical protein